MHPCTGTRHTGILPAKQAVTEYRYPAGDRHTRT